MTSFQIAISFDTTGSMSRALEEVRKRLAEMIGLLRKDIPGITIALIAHGDYCDADIYVTKHLDFTNDESALVTFAKDVRETGGGDTPECYELVLRLVRTKLSWKKKSQKILVVIGDAFPHPPDDPQNKDHIDWEQEARHLAGMPMRIYGAQINEDPESTEFFRKLTRITGGSHLKLTECAVLTDVIMAVCYRSQGTASLKGLETDVRARYAPNPLHKDLEEVFAALHEPLPVPTVPSKKTSSLYTYRGKDISFSWGGQVTATQPLSWKDPDDDDASVHNLQLKVALLGSEAKTYEANIVEMETTTFQGEVFRQPIVHLIGGKDSMVSLDLSFNSPVTFRLVTGSGPVHLTGQHVARALQDGDAEEEKAEEDELKRDTVLEHSPRRSAPFSTDRRWSTGFTRRQTASSATSLGSDTEETATPAASEANVASDTRRERASSATSLGSDTEETATPAASEANVASDTRRERASSATSLRSDTEETATPAASEANVASDTRRERASSATSLRSDTEETATPAASEAHVASGPRGRAMSSPTRRGSSGDTGTGRSSVFEQNLRKAFGDVSHLHGTAQKERWPSSRDRQNAGCKTS